jgi:hypothetical protein
LQLGLSMQVEVDLREPNPMAQQPPAATAMSGFAEMPQSIDAAAKSGSGRS